MATTQPALPDVNAQTYPYEMVQYLLDQTTSFSLFATPDLSFAPHATLTPGHLEDYFGINGGYGLDIKSNLRRFDSTVRSSCSAGFSIGESVGESAGAMHCRLLFGQGSFPWAPTAEPPCAIYDPWRAQRFAVQNFDVAFGSDNGFSGYGSGRTYPVVVQGRPLVLTAAMGNVMSGYGKFRDMNGSFTISGRITPELGFVGSVTVRFVDFEGRLRSDREPSGFNAVIDAEPDATFIVMRLDEEIRGGEDDVWAASRGSRNCESHNAIADAHCPIWFSFAWR